MYLKMELKESTGIWNWISFKKIKGILHKKLVNEIYIITLIESKKYIFNLYSQKWMPLEKVW
jgi:hypothetical protein